LGIFSWIGKAKKLLPLVWHARTIQTLKDESILPALIPFLSLMDWRNVNLFYRKIKRFPLNPGRKNM
jgi:hypothetical protein